MIVTLCVLSLISSLESTHADTTSDLQAKIQQQQQLIQDLNQKIQQYSDLADKTSQQAKSLQDVIVQLKQNQKILDLDIKKTGANINKTSLDIQMLGGQISNSEQKIVQYEDAIRRSINDIHQMEDVSLITTLLSRHSLSDFLSKIDQQHQFNKNIDDAINNLNTEKKNLKDAQDTKVSKKQELVDYQKQLADKKKVIEYNKSEQTKALIEAQNKKKTYQQIVADNTAKKIAFEQELYTYEAQLKFNLNPSSIPAAGSAVFSWPLDNVIITQRFGRTSAAKRLYVSGSHNGVDFGARIGTPVKATLSGTVLGSGDTDLTCPHASFGRWVFIKHDNGLSSIYAHLSVISAKTGERVSTGDIIGYSGATGYATGPHLHISVYASDAVKIQDRPSAACGGRVYTMPIAAIDGYLDPMLYFPPYNG